MNKNYAYCMIGVGAFLLIEALVLKPKREKEAIKQMHESIKMANQIGEAIKMEMQMDAAIKMAKQTDEAIKMGKDTVLQARKRLNDMKINYK